MKDFDEITNQFFINKISEEDFKHQLKELMFKLIGTDEILPEITRQESYVDGFSTGIRAGKPMGKNQLRKELRMKVKAL